MNKVFLQSGKLENYLPMGENGQAVYISALQLRETLRLREKESISQCLAIPQPNETGERIDWYSPIEGSVIPWSAASEEERAAAYDVLEKNQKALIAFSQDIQKKIPLHKENQLFGALLSKTIQFPDENHIFIVDGKPVITFWGFVNADQQLRIDPVACLKPVVAPIPPVSTVAPSAIEEKTMITQAKRPWWRFLWWLLPLLLLLLAIFFLRGCFSTPTLPTVSLNTPNIETPTLPDLSLETPSLPTVVNNGNTIAVPTGTIPTGTIGAVDANGQPINGTIDTGTLVDPNTNLPVIDPQTSALPEGTLPTGEQPSNIPPVDPAAQNEPPKTENNPNGSNENTPPAPVDPNLPPDVTPPTSANAATPLTIPANALANGSTQFLNGQWKAGAGIQDQKTGKPLSLNYQIDNGKGQVVMTRSDGVTCKAPVNAAINQGGLNINNQGQANCSDGSNYLMPNIICQPGSQNIADCQGKYDNSQPFPLSMKRENN